MTSTRQMPDMQVVLVNLPWASFRRPSIQTGLLVELARAEGFEAQTAHLNLELAAELGVGTYDAISQHRRTSLGDWLFAEAAFADRAPSSEVFIREYGDVIKTLPSRPGVDLSIEELVAFRKTGAAAFIQRQIARNDWSAHAAFGLTSTFQQNTACFAFARALKQVFPGCTVILGGANCDDEMGEEWLRSVPHLDLVVSGEGDLAFPALLRALSAGAEVNSIPNVISRCGESIHRAPNAPPFRDLDRLPHPNYEEYFDRVERLGLLAQERARGVTIPIETSRGCWWGERSHCTFCGLNGTTMGYRSKSPDHILGELAAQADAYGTRTFSAVDNILDVSYCKTLFPELIARDEEYELFFEIKTGLSREQLATLRDAGVRRVQPGIESLSTEVLTLMRKGVRAIANVNLLRWCKALNIEASWNLLWGFPGEQKEHYEAQLDLFPSLAHLQPPGGAGPIWLERFSPLYEERRRSMKPLLPERSLRYVYPEDVCLSRAAYFFEHDVELEVDDAVYSAVSSAVEKWQAAHSSKPIPTLKYRQSERSLQIDDERNPGSACTYTFDGIVADFYLQLVHRPVSIARLRASLGLDSADIRRSIDELSELRLIMREGDYLLGLALPER